MLNETINDNRFYIDMSGYTGKSNKFTAVPNSLGKPVNRLI